MRAVLFGLLCAAPVVLAEQKPKHHKKHHHKHHHHAKQAVKAAAQKLGIATPILAHRADDDKKEEEKKEEKKEEAAPGEDKLVEKIKALEGKLDAEKKTDDVANQVLMQGKIDVNGPLPADFDALFKQAAAKADASCKADEIKMVEKNAVTSFLQVSMSTVAVVELVFEAPVPCVNAIQAQAGDATSALVTGPMFNYLVAKSDVVENATEPVKEDGVDVDTQMPYGNLEPFGREDTAQELTEGSIKESDAMVDQMERAEVAEEKRSVFRALTRLRGAAITSFDGVARSQTGNIDEYNKVHKWRKTHPLHHLAAEESDTTKWAFPDQAD